MNVLKCIKKSKICVFSLFFFIILISDNINQKQINVDDNNSHTDLPKLSALTNYTMTTGYTYDWVNVVTGGTALGFSNPDESASVTLPFTFNYYDTDYTAIYITSNGYLTFANPNPLPSPGEIPNSGPKVRNMIAPFWVDLDGSTGEVYYQSFGTYWVVAWINLNYTGGNLVSGQFEVRLENDGVIIFNFNYLDDVPVHSCGVNYGVDTSYYNSYSGLSSSTSNFAIKFDIASSNGGNGGEGGSDDDDDDDTSEGSTYAERLLATRIAIIVAIVFLVIGSWLGVSLFLLYRDNPEEFRASVRKTKENLKIKFNNLSEKLREKKTPKEEKKRRVKLKRTPKSSKGKKKPRPGSFRDKLVTKKDNLNVKLRGVSEKIRPKED